MSKHIHLIFSARGNNPQRLLQNFKSSTAKELIELIKSNVQESKREISRLSDNINKMHFFKHINNPMESGKVAEAEHYQCSSAIDYAGGKGMLKVHLMV